MQVMESARKAASKARRTGVVIGFMTAASLLVGAAAAWVAALRGSPPRWRDGFVALIYNLAEPGGVQTLEIFPENAPSRRSPVGRNRHAGVGPTGRLQWSDG